MEDYKSIKSFLDRFRIKFSEKDKIKEIVINSVFNKTKYKPEKDFVSIKRGVVFIRTTPIIKSEILIHKKEILEDLSLQISSFKIFDIK